ncbi:GvpL/GvpF family gas vesicle protein [bacterium]|nr:GvpL/GvpF family gas vesicle protein [bacterium]
MMEQLPGLYIYGIIETSQEKSFGRIGIGEEKPEATTVCFRDIAAVVSETHIEQFDEDKEFLTQYIATHQQVLEFVMKTDTVVPMKFGIVAQNMDDLMTMLDRAYIQFITVLNRLRGKVELAVQACWNQQAVVAEIASTDSNIQRLLSQLAASEESDIQAKIKIGRVIHGRIAKQTDAFRTNIRNFLRPYAVDVASNQLLTEDMLMNGAFLVDKEREAEFDEKVNEISDKYEGKLQFKYIGPMPAYSFTNIELTITKFELIDNARKMLGLGEEATMTEIQDAYRKLATEYHPDRHPDAAEAQEKFKKIAEAYEILEVYCQNYRYSFGKEQVEKTIAVRN